MGGFHFASSLDAAKQKAKPSQKARSQSGRDATSRPLWAIYEPETGGSRADAATRTAPVRSDAEPTGQGGGESFKSAYREGKFLVLADRVPDAGDASDIEAFEVVRDYTMYERAEVPQDYPPVKRR